MKIFLGELRKMFTAPIFIFAVAAAILLNIYLCVTQKPYEISDSDYREYFSELSGLSNSEKVEKITALYEDFSFDDFSRESFFRREFYRKELEKARQCEEYQSFLAGIKEAADKMTAVSLFADKNSFSYKNIKRTPAAYEKVENVTPIYSPSAGVLLAIDNSGCDVLLIFTALAAVVVLVAKERETGVSYLTKPLKYGRAHLSLAKTAAIFTACFLAGAAVYGSAFLVGGLRFGLGDLSRPIQSLEGFLGSDLPISVGAGAAIILAVKILTAFLAALMLECLCLALPSVFAYLITAGFAVLEIVAHSSFGANSALAFLGEINLAAFLDSRELLGTYLNINLFGEPCNILAVTGITLGAGIILLRVLSSLMFSRIPPKSFNRFKLAALTSRNIPKKPFTYALYKQFITHRGAAIILIILAFCVYTSGNYRQPYSSDDVSYKTYCEQFAELSYDEADKFGKAEKERFEFLETQPQTLETQRALQARYGFEQAYSQYQYIRELDSANKAMFYETGWRRLFAADSATEDMRLALVSVIGVCLCVSPLIAYDNKRRLGFLFYSTKNGKRRYFVQHTASAALASTFVSLSVNIPHIIGVIRVYGNGGSEYSIRCIGEFGKFFDISIGAYMALLVTVRIIVLFFVSLLILFVSQISKSPAAALLISAIIFALPITLYLAGVEFAAPFCAPLSVNREILDGAFVYPIVLTASCAGAAYLLFCGEKNDVKNTYHKGAYHET